MNSEQLLIDAAKQGDASAFRNLVETYKKPVYYVAYDLTGKHHAAEDLSQEVFLKMYQGLDKFRGDSAMKTWLYRIAVNTYLSQQRKKSWKAVQFFTDQERDDNPEMEIMPPTSDPSPEQEAAASMINVHIQQALKKLSPRERSVFVLRHFQDLPLKEIAEILEIHEGTVKSTLFRAIKRLRKALAFYKQDLGLEE